MTFPGQNTEVILSRAHKTFCLVVHNDGGNAWFVFTLRAQERDCSLSFLTRCLFLFTLSLCFPMNKYLHFRGNVSVTCISQNKQCVHFPLLCESNFAYMKKLINRFPRDAWEGVILATKQS